MSHPFVEEIDFNEITLEGVVGKGSFGTVQKGKWRNLDVAVKIIVTEQEKKAFFIEVKQLSRVNHPNIVRLYGACTKMPVCLVMEYAEGGSLYNVLHFMKDVEYTAAHAISWMLQCATGVAYLHNMKPRALIHRDLKPPNLLLVMGGTVLKICDFGTACDCHTVMTNNKGSAAWMAPEVFEGSQYSEKCDIFSWAIILWEVFSRTKPFHDGETTTAFGIMWAVHSGKRPPLIHRCPRPIERLMTRCWAKDPMSRPPMAEVVSELTELFKFCKGADKSICFSSKTSNKTDDEPVFSNTSNNESRGSEQRTVQQILDYPVTFDATQYVSSKETDESILSVPFWEKKRHSADFSGVDIKLPSTSGHRRSGSCDSSYLKGVVDDTKQAEIGNTNYDTNNNESANQIHNTGNYAEDLNALPNNSYLSLEPRLQPPPPVKNCPESIAMFEEHCKLAQELLQLRAERLAIAERKDNLEKQLDSSSYNTDSLHLEKEKESLLQLRENLKAQLEILKRKYPQEQQQRTSSRSSDDWVMV